MSGAEPGLSNHTASALSRDEAVAVLERFVVDNDELRELEAQIGRFNVFDALGVVRAEIRHSTFLRWLLDPNESHGQGALFLRAVLMDVLRSTPAELRPLSPIDLDGVELRGVDVRTEWNRVDVLITCEEPAFVVAIENKIDSGEHSDQLSRYHEAVTRHFGDRRALYVFLTREGDEPSEAQWTPYSYRQLHRVLERVSRTSEGAIGDDVRVFLDHYVLLLRSRFMDHPDIDDLVAKIYKQHRQAIDLIVERKPDPKTELVDATVGALRHHIDFDDRVAKGSMRTLRRLVPRLWSEILPAVGSDASFPSSWCYVAVTAEVSGKTPKLVIRSVVRETEPATVREVLVRLIEGADPEVSGFKRTSRRGITASMSRVSHMTVLKGGELDALDDDTHRRITQRVESFAREFEKMTTFLRRVQPELTAAAEAG